VELLGVFCVQISGMDKRSDLEKLAVRNVPSREESDDMPPLIQVCIIDQSRYANINRCCGCVMLDS